MTRPRVDPGQWLDGVGILTLRLLHVWDGVGHFLTYPTRGHKQRLRLHISRTLMTTRQSGLAATPISLGTGENVPGNSHGISVFCPFGACAFQRFDLLCISDCRDI